MQNTYINAHSDSLPTDVEAGSVCSWASVGLTSRMFWTVA